MPEHLDKVPQVWLTLAELADRWKVCKRTITRIDLYELPCSTLPTMRRYRLQDIERYEQNHAAGTKPETEPNKQSPINRYELPAYTLPTMRQHLLQNLERDEQNHAAGTKPETEPKKETGP